ncbi:MAG: hypothetical protein JNM56_35525 [Planctomycetia bacterium]|nr:hypothetical protein [Planctomycetia bacterium]
MDVRGKWGKRDGIPRPEFLQRLGRRASWATFGFGMLCILGVAAVMFALTACRAFR